MLLGIEHIQFCVRDVAVARSYLERAGYRTVFQIDGFDLGVEQLPRYRRRGRSMVYLQGADSALELIDGDTDAATAGYVPVLPHAMTPSGVDPAAGTIRVAPLATVCGTGASESSLQRLRLRTARLDDSVRFWRELGGRVEDGNGSAVTLSFAARIATMPLRLTLQETDAPPNAEAFVDELGCRLVALLSTSLEADLERIAEAGGLPGEVRSLSIHGRALRVSFVVAPSGELVEIIEAGR